MQDAGFYHEQLPAGVIRIRTCLLAYAALGPVCLWALRRKVFRGGWRRAAASLAAWLPGFAAAAAGAWLHSKALAAGGAWAQVFWGTGAAAGWLAAGAWLASGWLRLYWLRAAAVFLGAAWIAVAGPMELARRFPPERHAVWQDGRNARARFATDGRDAFILVSRGPDGRFDSSPETLRQALQPSFSAAPSGLEALALRAYDPTNGARGGGDWFAAGTADSVRFLGFSAP
ncbi:MAG: hypothetical protein BWZ10_02471 [candidate division BRC1 bacterium ADurb.BinA364]|nr:MAG: hypothetical protein BWZ10_02471 [candidate division BRC1 bacterium ADurb.BinA364]